MSKSIAQDAATEAAPGNARALPLETAAPAGAGPTRLTQSGRLSALELEPLELHHGTHPGDAYVRRAHPDAARFRRLGPGRLEALPGATRPARRWAAGSAR